MKKAFLMAGVALTLSLVLIMALNYVVYSNRLVESSVQQRMMIDHAGNRATDLNRIVYDSALDAKSDGLTPGAIQSRVENSLLSAKLLMSSDSLTLAYKVTHVDANRISGNYNISGLGFFKAVSFDITY